MTTGKLTRRLRRRNLELRTWDFAFKRRSSEFEVTRAFQRVRCGAGTYARRHLAFASPPAATKPSRPFGLGRRRPKRAARATRVTAEYPANGSFSSPRV